MNKAAPGFFGKVASHGDFVMRALPSVLVQAWDEWMQQAIHASRDQLGADWLPLYLTSPIWRFAVAAGVLGPDAWAGVMMPSVDRVGRHFPLMIAAPVASSTPLTALVAHGIDWYDALEDFARSTLAADFVLERLEPMLAALAPITAGASVACEAGAAGWRMASGARDELPPRLADVLLQGHSLWWTEGAPAVEASILACRGMPEPQAFASMLDGRWRERGWGIARFM